MTHMYTTLGTQLVGWIIGKVGMGSSWQLSWHASSAILAQGRRCQQAVKIFETHPPTPEKFMKIFFEILMEGLR